MKIEEVLNILAPILNLNKEYVGEYLMEFGNYESKSILTDDVPFSDEEQQNIIAADLFNKLSHFIEYVKRSEYERAKREILSQTKLLIFPTKGGYITLSNKYYMPYESIPNDVTVAEFSLDSIPELLKAVSQETLLRYKGIIIDDECCDEEEEETLALLYDTYQIDDAEDEDGNDIIVPLPPDEEEYINKYIN